MFVSAVSINDNTGYRMSNRLAYTNARTPETISDTVFNSLSSKQTSDNQSAPMVFDSINQWQKFCHQRILGEKLNIIA